MKNTVYGDILRERFLDSGIANEDLRPIGTAVALVLPTGQKRVAYRIIGSYSFVARSLS